MNPKDIWILYTMELRSAMRERAIVVNSILMPIFLYPVLLWVMFSAMTFHSGAERGLHLSNRTHGRSSGGAWGAPGLPGGAETTWR